MAGKRIGLLSSWVSRANGGVFEAVVRQAELLRSLGATPVVLGVDDPHHGDDRWRLDGAEVLVARRSGPAALAYAPGLDRLLDEARLDALHLHGVWQYPTRAAGRWARRSGKGLTISPHGMFDRWITGRNAWKKHAARFGWERQAWRSAARFHALTGAEADDIRREAGGGVPVDVIANPAPALSPPAHSPRPPVALYIGRIHEKKNIAALVAAWHRALPRLPQGAVLTIAGWGDDDGIAALEEAMRNAPPYAGDSVEFVGATFGSQKAALFDIARFCVLPSLSEGLPMVALEAWAAGTPMIMSRECHLPEGVAAGAAIECGTDVAGIADALERAFALPEAEWAAMSDAARALAGGAFSAAAIARQWEQVYSALVAGAA